MVVVSEGGVSLRFATVDDKTAANQKAPQPLELWQVRSKISSVLTISNEHQEQRITNLEREFSQVKRQLIRTLHKFRLQEEEKPS
ncbi:MAG: hypothetical protein U5L96_12530 [Owenweeksia sp.]|nr:hypothetical protein [Owenweeksia sp.]